MIDYAGAVLGLTPYAQDGYADLDYDRLALFGLSLLQEMGLPTTLANLSVALYRLFPARFSLSSYDFPDSSKVQQAFLHLRPKYRNWVEGSPTRGLFITARGRSALDQTRRLLGQAVTSKDAPVERRSTPPPSDALVRRELAHIRTSELFRSHETGQPASLDSRLVYEMLGVLAYTPKPVVCRRMRTLQHMAELAQDEELKTFLGWVYRTYGRVFGRTGTEATSDNG